jgi:hypothetical protein
MLFSSSFYLQIKHEDSPPSDTIRFVPATRFPFLDDTAIENTIIIFLSLDPHVVPTYSVFFCGVPVSTVPEA